MGGESQRVARARSAPAHRTAFHVTHGMYFFRPLWMDLFDSFKGHPTAHRASQVETLEETFIRRKMQDPSADHGEARRRLQPLHLKLHLNCSPFRTTPPHPTTIAII
jgi:hypothetical protein